MTYSVIMNLKLLPISTTILFWVCICCYKTSSMANSTTGCEPKSCGNLTNISYPFWLSGHQPSFCGDLAFELNCSNNAPILVNSYAGMLQVLAINYENNSFQVLNPLVHGFCPILAYNLFLNPTKYFKVSEENRELFFLHNCKVPPSNYSERMNCTPGGTFAYLGGHYGNSSLPASSSGCNVTTAPVLIKGEEEKDYFGLMSKGYLMEWQDVADCSKCRASGGTCGYSEPNSTFLCICNGGWHYSSTCNNGLRDFCFYSQI